VNGIRTPQALAHLVFRGQLSDSVKQARHLHDEMILLRESSRMTVARLTESLAAMEKTCVSCASDRAKQLPPNGNRGARHRASRLQKTA
jgi:hypothetical protein